jgi:hypothetical protein
VVTVNVLVTVLEHMVYVYDRGGRLLLVCSREYFREHVAMHGCIDAARYAPTTPPR